jgi:hypothetical protein
MTDAPLRAHPEDRPLPPSGGNPPVAAPGHAGAASAAAGPAKAPATADKAPARPAAHQIRPIGRPARPARDWRASWSGFCLGGAALVIAIGAAWLLWDLAGAPRTAQVPIEQLPAIDLAEMEALLDGLGFPPGEVDGVIDGDAAAAIRDFQTTAGLPIDGQPSAALLEELRAAHIELTGGGQ